MLNSETVVVHMFKKWNITTDKYDFSRSKRTAEDIKSLSGVIIEGTAETVARLKLDPNGSYKPEGAESL